MKNCVIILTLINNTISTNRFIIVINNMRRELYCCRIILYVCRNFLNQAIFVACKEDMLSVYVSIVLSNETVKY